jgi:hypothetical protein
VPSRSQIALKRLLLPCKGGALRSRSQGPWADPYNAQMVRVPGGEQSSRWSDQFNVSKPDRVGATYQEGNIDRARSRRAGTLPLPTRRHDHERSWHTDGGWLLARPRRTRQDPRYRRQNSRADARARARARRCAQPTADIGLVVTHMNTKTFGDYIVEQTKFWRDFTKENGIKFD